jgi:hypothetical protein
MSLNNEKQRYIDDDDTIIPCEICNAPVKNPNIHSQVCWYAIPGATGSGMQAYAPTHCRVVQHYACCWEHATLASITCLLTHLREQPHAVGEQGERRDDGTFISPELSAIYEVIKKYE